MLVYESEISFCKVHIIIFNFITDKYQQIEYMAIYNLN